jgi:hypothetical protein
VTSFFQDPLVFTVMGKCRARMREHAAEGERPWSVLSLGCSAGADLYSCTMLLDSLGLLDRARLLGTDCHPGRSGPRGRVCTSRAGWKNRDRACATGVSRRTMDWCASAVRSGRRAHGACGT